METDKWLIRHTPEKGLELHPDFEAELRRKRRSMSPAERKKFVDRGPNGLTLPDAMLWALCCKDSDDVARRIAKASHGTKAK